ncbi:hypothetical protein KC799_22045 [candidate division KSB1 bacterium]|nr:hypothetical protein [candidate division KSB1 bacterium]
MNAKKYFLFYSLFFALLSYQSCDVHNSFSSKQPIESAGSIVIDLKKLQRQVEYRQVSILKDIHLQISQKNKAVFDQIKEIPFEATNVVFEGVEIEEGRTTFSAEIASNTGQSIYISDTTLSVTEGLNLQLNFTAIAPILSVEPDTITIYNTVYYQDSSVFFISNRGTDTLNWWVEENEIQPVQAHCSGQCLNLSPLSEHVVSPNRQLLTVYPNQVHTGDIFSVRIRSEYGYADVFVKREYDSRPDLVITDLEKSGDPVTLPGWDNFDWMPVQFTIKNLGASPAEAFSIGAESKQLLESNYRTFFLTADAKNISYRLFIADALAAGEERRINAYVQKDNNTSILPVQYRFQIDVCIEEFPEPYCGIDESSEYNNNSNILTVRFKL